VANHVKIKPHVKAQNNIENPVGNLDHSMGSHQPVRTSVKRAPLETQINLLPPNRDKRYAPHES
jgi:hypothetical protein